MGEADWRFPLEWITASDSGIYREGFQLYDGDEFQRWAEQVAVDSVDGIEAEIEHDIAECANLSFVMHGGVVGWNGSAIMLPGPTRAEK